MTKARKLRELIARDGIIVTPGGFSPLVGIIAEQLGFECLYMSGYGVAAYRLGVPDVGLTTMTEVLDNARNMARSTNLPLIADVDTGYGNAVNMRRCVEEFESAGVAGIEMEDQVWPKQCGHMEGKQLIPAAEMANKIRAAVDARKDPDFVIIARTDANTVLGFDEAIRRLQLYRASGADLLFFESPTSEDQLVKIPSLLDGPVMINMSEGAKTPLRSNKELEELGYKLVIWPSSTTWSAAKAIHEVLKELKENGTTAGALESMYLFHEFNELIGLGKHQALAKKYT